MRQTTASVSNVLTRTTGFLATVTSHSLQPYRGCSYGRALCGESCYVQHNWYVTKGRPWGTFLEVREDAAESYIRHYHAERRWAREKAGAFGIFLSSSTDPFVPQEFEHGVTRRVLEAMVVHPPDVLILQTHTHEVLRYLDLYPVLARCCNLRVHISIETDREHIEGLRPHASSVEKRFVAAAALKAAGLRTVITVSPLLPIADPDGFFERVAKVADAVVLDHFIQGDGTALGTRTLRTALPAIMEQLDPNSVHLGYRDAMVEVARRYLPGRVGINIDGFAGRFLQ